MHDALDLRGVVSDREQERGLVLHIDEECRDVDALRLECGLSLVSAARDGREDDAFFANDVLAVR